MAREIPLVVDLDGSLLRSDLLLESGLVFLREHPLRWFAPMVWLLAGKARLKHELAMATEIDVSVLPYNPAVVEFIQTERARGRHIVLATASHRRFAEQVARHLGLFDEIFATDASRNLSARIKRDTLVLAFGDKGFDYLGNSRDDLPVWAAARHAYVVDASAATLRRLARLDVATTIIASASPSLQTWSQSLRPHQWQKNVLLFVPLLAAHRYGEWWSLVDVLLAFICFGLAASSVYILNDLLDLQDDRHHPKKRQRPLAAGTLSIHAGLATFPILLVGAFSLAFYTLPLIFSVGLAGYYALTLAYSLVLKRRMVIDVITLAALYTLRIIVGAAVLGLAPSFWLLAFSMFLFLSLALVKRYAELYRLRAHGREEKARGRGYYADDLAMIASLGAAAGYMAVMVLALYINDGRAAQLYRHQEIIWLACPLLLTWISRVWMLAHRGVMHEDPVVFAVHDRFSLVIGALMALVFWAAL